MSYRKSQTLYKSPFSLAYWRDAAAELKDVKILVIAALIIAIRVALKLVYIPLAPNLKINTAFVANAIGAMIYGPVVAMIAAAISDFLGVLISGDVYFFPFILTEIAGSLIFALFLYRARITPLRVMLSRFLICLLVNILLQTPLMMLYYQIMMGGKTYLLTIPHILKNLFMFPIESVVLTLILSALQPITYRMKLTYCSGQALKFTKRQVAFLGALFVVGSVFVIRYLFYYYDTTSLSASYTAQERFARNGQMDTIIHAETDNWNSDDTIAVVESAYRKLGKGYITYNVAFYTVDSAALSQSGDDMAALQGLSKSKAAKHEAMTRVADATIVLDRKSEEVLDFHCDPSN